MYNTIQIKRRVSGSAGAPVALSGGELAFNEVNNTLYYGASATNGGVIAIGGNGSFVDRTSSQTISGSKTFSGLTTLSSTSFSVGSVLDFNGNVLTDIGTPVNNADAATKLYVDGLAGSGGSALTALSAEVYNNFVEKTESQAVVLNGGLTVTNNLSANAVFTTGNASIGGNLTVTGDFTVLGDISTLETTTSVTSAFSITNAGSTTALVVNQTGITDIAEFKDDGSSALIIKNGGNVGIGTAAPNEKLTVVGNISATGTIYADGGMSIDGGGATTTLWVQNGKVGINTETPNEELTVVGSISASQHIFAVNGDFTGTLDADGAATLGSTLYVTNAATFASSVSAAGSLTVDGSATFNADATVVDKLQVQSSNFVLNTAGTHVEIEGSNVKVVNDAQTSDTTYGLNGITNATSSADYTIATTFAGSNKIVIDSNGAANDIDLAAANVNITTGDLEVQAGDLNGSGTNFINDFIIDGGSF